MMRSTPAATPRFLEDGLFVTYNNTPYPVSQDELRDLVAWLHRVMPPGVQD
jgi:hypothetical protein